VKRLAGQVAGPGEQFLVSRIAQIIDIDVGDVSLPTVGRRRKRI